MDGWIVNSVEAEIQLTCQLESENGQATKGSRRIPWHTEAMKDVVTCDKSRGAGSTL